MKINRAARACRIVLAGSLLLVPGVSRASDSAPMAPPPPRPELTPEQQATELYNDGISYRDKAAKLEKEAADEKDVKKREKLEAKAKDRHEASIKKFAAATKKSPRLHQAWSSLGYAYRKTGDLDASLDAYGRALEIQPNYTPAVEYLAETHLGLNRLDDVKAAYMKLFNLDRPRADELAAAIAKWLEKKKADPVGVDPGALDEFSKWAQERKQLAAQTSSLTKPTSERW